ncbi:HD-GYP domain-containing protein [Methylobacterium sp. J-076]|uniref:HD-GYP domain-containing protein n=1 Tax=Methylobacterium sp. J-076 TaxID=2836655 RepID=UPI001FB9C4CB|nr:HD domain-containing phosphohydrolase [Methylobacterium sp. J-076]MCJ2012705.1 HD domain-containing protein [Methylobacterium sp. J-076]
MADLLLITDDLRHAERLVRDLDGREGCRIHDLYGEAEPAGHPSLIVSDVRDLTSEALVRLRRCVDAVHGQGVPHLLLVHGHAARAEIQARLLGAETLPAAAAARLLPARMRDRAASPPPASAVAVRHAREAGRFLDAAFFAGDPITPTLADTGTELVARAIHEAGIGAWVRAVQRFDDVTHQHILLVAGLSAAFACRLGLSPRDRHHLAKAALLHDVGKTKIPAAILKKPARLDREELRIMRTHAALGHAMLAGSGFDPATLAVVRSHHEMLDGSGYPDGLRGGQIPDLVRLVTIGDIYAALIERRPYKSALTEAAALAILTGMTGRLDADLVRAFRPVADAFDPAATGATA